jgi:hypothetical protein
LSKKLGASFIRKKLYSSAFQLTGAGIRRPYFLSLLAETYGKIEQLEEGLIALAESLAVVQKTGERRDEAELYRLKGELTLQLKVEREKWKEEEQKAKIGTALCFLMPDVQGEAEACFLKAIDIACMQPAKMLELHATVSLARLWRQQGKRHEARQRLAAIYNWFTEGFDTVDLKEAKALLEELM